MPNPIYSGPNRSGVCICGHTWDRHHLGMVAKQEYIDSTHEYYIPQECEAHGFNEVGGMKYNKETEEWEVHCFGYVDSMKEENDT